MTKTETIVARLESLIRSGAMKPGDRLPSVRAAAEEHAVGKNTVVEAYDRLRAGGLIQARPGSGFTVAELPRAASRSRPRHVAEAVDIASLLNAQLSESFTIRAGDGRPPPSWTEESEMRRHLGFAGRAAHSSHDGYGSAMGYLPLRERLSASLLEREIDAAPEQILLTFGANHALDLVIRRFLVAGDTVLVDDPGYYPLFAKLKLAQVRMVGVRRLSNGPDPEDLAEKMARERPRLFFTQSLAHNPTGGSTALATAHAVLTAAARADVMVVEDDPFVDLPGVRGVSLAALDQFRNLIAVRTFSKTLSASLRCGFIVARPDVTASLAELKMLTTVNSSGHVERLVHGIIVDGHYRRHLKRLDGRIRQATEAVAARFDALGLKLFAEPSGGYYVFLLLPPGADDLALARQGAAEGIFIAPGSVFSPEPAPATPGIRINIAQAESPLLFEFLQKNLAA